jgi:peptidoglycan/xylan/chitin deacetylase (PgdA/CDA1 family)
VTKPLVALTFDDGPGVLSPEALRTLRRHDATATFFLVGKLVEETEFTHVLQEEVRFGAAFGDHTWDHVGMTGRSPAFMNEQIARTRHAIEARTHAPVTLFRPPFGTHDAALDTYVRSQGMLEVIWSIDSGDSQGANADEIFQRVRQNLSPGDIILMHDNRASTENALPQILDLIDQRGFTTVTVPQLLAMDPPSTQQLMQGSCS